MVSLKTNNRLNKNLGIHKTLWRNRVLERHALPIYVARIVMPLGRFIDALIGLGVK